MTKQTFLVTIKWVGGERDVYQVATGAEEAVRLVRRTLSGQEARWASVFC